MTSTTDTDGHPEVAEISALTEGILPPARSASLRDHLAACVPCRDVHRSLDEIRALLSALPGPARMPADIADRMDAALAAEAVIGTTTQVPSADTLHGTPARGGAVSRETTPARRPGGAALTGPGRRPRRRRPWLRTLLVTACSAAVLVGGVVMVRSLTAEGSGGPASGVGAFSGVELPVRVHQLLASASPKAGPQATRSNPMHLDLATVPACVLSGTGRSGVPLASTRGSYHHHDAYLIVLPHPSDGTRVDAYVVDASCDSAASPAPGRLLAQQTYHR